MVYDSLRWGFLGVWDVLSKNTPKKETVLLQGKTKSYINANNNNSDISDEHTRYSL